MRDGQGARSCAGGQHSRTAPARRLGQRYGTLTAILRTHRGVEMKCHSLPTQDGTKRRITLEDGRKTPFFWVESSVVDTYLWKIGPNAFAVYCVLCRHAHNETQVAWPSQRTIADLAWLSLNTIKKAIRALVKAKLISVSKRGRIGRQHNVYTLIEAKINGRTGSRDAPAGVTA